MKLGVFSAVLFLLFNKIKSFPDGFVFPSNIGAEAAILFIGFMPLNWFMEWLKWKAVLKNKEVSSNIRWHSFLSGIVSSVVTPAYAGNFIGRMFYFDKKDRKAIILNTLISNASQFVISIAFGGIAFLVLYQNTLTVLEGSIILSINLSLFLFYFFGDHIVKKIPFDFLNQLDLILVSKSLRLNLLILSLFRYCIFVLQFYLALLVFNVPFDLNLIFWIILMFGVITVSPSLFFGKIIVRETIALTILSLAGITGPTILLAAFSTWFINQIAPVLIATLLLKKENKHVLV